MARCWCGYLSGARCRLAHGPADAIATHCRVVPEKGPLNRCVCVCVCVCVCACACARARARARARACVCGRL